MAMQCSVHECLQQGKITLYSTITPNQIVASHPVSFSAYMQYIFLAHALRIVSFLLQKAKSVLGIYIK